MDAGRELVVANDHRLRVELSQLGDQPEQLLLLGGGPGIGRLARLIQPALVADADRAVVDAPGMRAHLAQQAGMGGRAVGPDVEVVAGGAEAAAAVVAFQLFGGVGPREAGRGAVDHDEADALRRVAHILDCLERHLAGGSRHRQDLVGTCCSHRHRQD